MCSLRQIVMKPLGASRETLIRRTVYGGRKGRRAVLRLWYEFSTTVSWRKPGWPSAYRRRWMRRTTKRIFG